jgi:PQ loop repeat
MVFVHRNGMDFCYPPVRTSSFPSSNQISFKSQYFSLFLFITTVYLLSTSTLSPDGALPSRISSWATFLGVSSALLATVQYAPQLLHTYRMKLVGALSIHMMLIQTPGGILMVTSIALRKGTNWTSAFLFFFWPLMKA